MSELINTTRLEIAATTTFKDARLAEATTKIRNIYYAAMSYAEEKNREIALILSDVKQTKCYEADGFTSVGEYAEQVFGIKKMSAYSLALAGDVYNDENASAGLKALSPSKVAELARYDRQSVEMDIEVGVITPDTTQKQIREHAKKYYTTESKKNKKTSNVVPTYTAHFIGFPYGIEIEELNKERIIEDWTEFMIEHMGPATEVYDLPKITDGNVRNVLRKLYLNRAYSCVVMFYPVVNGKSTAPVKLTDDELAIMLEQERRKAKEDTDRNSSSPMGKVEAATKYGKIKKDIVKDMEAAINAMIDDSTDVLEDDDIEYIEEHTENNTNPSAHTKKSK